VTYKLHINRSVANLAVFPRIWACFFVDLRFLWRIAGCLFWSLFWLKFACFLGLFFADFCIADCFFYQISWTFCSFNLLQNEIWACFCVNLLILGLFSGFVVLFLYLTNLLVLCFFEFPYQTHVGLVFPLNYPFWACFSNLLACFYKITWHHWSIDTVGSWNVMLVSTLAEHGSTQLLFLVAQNTQEWRKLLQYFSNLENS